MKFKNKVALAAMLGVSLLATACSTEARLPLVQVQFQLRLPKRPPLLFGIL